MNHLFKNQTSRPLSQMICLPAIVVAFAASATSAFAQQGGTNPDASATVEVAVATPLSGNKSDPLKNANINIVANAGPADAPAFRIVDRDLAKSRIAQLVTETKTAMWKAKIMETTGDEVERSSIATAWAGTELQRIKVKTGRGAGKTLLVRGDMVSSGWLKFRHTNGMVKTVRGNSLKLNGYLDDLAHLLTDWESVAMTDYGGDWIIEFVAPNGVDSKLWINSTTLKASKMEAREDGALVGLYEYESVVYNPKFPPSFWKK